MIAALILARGGSKGIPGKNLQQVGGVSLVGRCVREAVKSRMHPVYVWSDSEAIRFEARRWGAWTPERPAELSGDGVSTEDTTRGWLRQEDPTSAFSAVAVLQATTPFLKAKHLDKAVELFGSGRFDSVVSVCRFGRFLGYPSHDRVTEFIPLRPYRALRQAQGPEVYMENGGIYLAARRIWEQGKRIGAACGVVEMGWWESLEIDEAEDLVVAKLIAGLFREGEAELVLSGSVGPSSLKWVHHEGG